MTALAPPPGDTATTVEKRPPKVKPPPRRPVLTRWLIWLARFVALAALVVAVFVMSRDEAPVWTHEELEAIAETYAGDLEFIPSETPVYSVEFQSMLDEIAASYEGDLDPRPLPAGHPYALTEMARTYGTDLDTGAEDTRQQVLDDLARFAAMYEGKLIEPGR